MYQYTIYICISWYNKIWQFPVRKCCCQRNSERVSHDSYIFWIFFRSGITVPSLIIVGHVWQILGRGAFLPHPPSVSSPENAHPEGGEDMFWKCLKCQNTLCQSTQLGGGLCFTFVNKCNKIIIKCKEKQQPYIQKSKDISFKINV